MRIRTTPLRVWPVTLALLLWLPPATRSFGQAPSAATKQDPEVEIGKEAFQELKAKGEIVASSPLYDTLTPIEAAIRLPTARPAITPARIPGKKDLFFISREPHCVRGKRTARTCSYSIAFS